MSTAIGARISTEIYTICIHTNNAISYSSKTKAPTVRELYLYALG